MDEERFERERFEAAKGWRLNELAARRQGLFELAVFFQNKTRFLSMPEVSFSLFTILNQVPRGPLEVLNRERRRYFNLNY